MLRNFSSMVNICADGLIDVISKQYDNADLLYDKWIGKYLDDTEIGIMLFNVNYHVSYIPCVAWDTAWKKVDGAVVSEDELKSIKHWSHKFVKAHNMGIEPYSMVIEQTHKRGAKAWFSVRMNEFHYLAHDITASSFWSDNPQYRLGETKPFDYSNKPVRDYYLSYICELCRKYNIDGIELDFLRGPDFFGEKPDNEAMTEFIKEIRNNINRIAAEKNKEIRLSARVYLNYDKCLEKGLDAVKWARNEFIDILTLSNFFIPTTYYAPVRLWKKLISNDNCKINIATDFCSFCTKWDEKQTRYLKNNTKTLKGFAANAFFEGADGIYTFNVMLDGFTNDVDLNLKVNFKEFSDYQSAVSGERSHIYTFDEQFEDAINLPLKSGKIKINTAKKPDRLYQVIMGVNSDNAPECSIENTVCRLAGVVSGRKYNPDIKNPPQIEDISETAKNVYIFETEDFEKIKNGENEIFFNCSDDVVWLQVNVD